MYEHPVQVYKYSACNAVVRLKITIKKRNIIVSNQIKFVNLV